MRAHPNTNAYNLPLLVTDARNHEVPVDDDRLEASLESFQQFLLLVVILALVEDAVLVELVEFPQLFHG
jgi:predicted lysophospholipase L1 biosynthesis ABC-type transport system permease subunit